MTNVALEGMHFFAYHGFYEEERIVGNPFIVDVYINLNSFDSTEDNISDTVNYEHIYNVVKSHMELQYKLLETIALNIGQELKSKFPHVHDIKVRVTKIAPQLGGEVDKAVIEYNC